MGFQLSPISYLEKEAPWFANIIDQPDLTIKTKLVFHDQSITDSKDKKEKKRFKMHRKEKNKADEFFYYYKYKKASQSVNY